MPQDAMDAMGLVVRVRIARFGLESDGAMPPLEQQEADPVDLPDLA